MWPFKGKTTDTAASGTGETEVASRRGKRPKKKKAEAPPEPKYAKPKILLIDMSEECTKVLQHAGYNVSIGTFGSPYRVKRSSDFRPVSYNSCSLPGLQEQEIIIANTRCPEVLAKPSQEEEFAEGVTHHWQSMKLGVIDPRPLFMAQIESDVHRIRQHGGLVIILVEDRYEIEYSLGQSHFGRVDLREPSRVTNLSFLRDLDDFKVGSVRGEEIIFEDSALAQCLKRGSKGATYSSTFEPDYRHEKKWFTLAKNKYEDDIAGGLAYGEDIEEFLLVLPQMPEFHTVVLDLIENWCSAWRPSLFPHLTELPWVHENRYEIPKVLTLVGKIKRVEAEAEGQVDKLRAQIKRVREEEADWHGLLCGTGDELAVAVIRSLERLGFKKVTDVDKEKKEKGEDRDLREDIQIHDRSPTLIADVKGVTGRPDDDESRQAEKHAKLRMIEWKRTDVQAIMIINCERHLPPHERYQQAYRQEMIDYAEKYQNGLMTTYDVFRLLRNKEKHGWPDDTVLPVFYRTGRIDPVPEHYTYIGDIVKTWESAFGIVPCFAVPAGATLAVEVGILFEEFETTSLMIDDQSVEEAPVESACGVAYEGASEKLRKGMRVFIIDATKVVTGTSV